MAEASKLKQLAFWALNPESKFVVDDEVEIKNKKSSHYMHIIMPQTNRLESAFYTKWNALSTCCIIKACVTMLRPPVIGTRLLGIVLEMCGSVGYQIRRREKFFISAGPDKELLATPSNSRKA